MSRDLRLWVDAQTALGLSREAIFHALLDAGWQAPMAGRALQLSPETTASFHVPAPGTMPSVALDSSGTMVDAGDKWVRVKKHLRQGVQQPALCVFANLLSDTECAALIDTARPRLSRSLTVDTRTGGEELNADRTSQGMFFTRGENALVQRVETRIARLLGWPVQNGEGLQVLRYGTGAQYKPHYDYFDPGKAGTAAILQRGGQRVATLIMYLHAPAQGGATVFPDIGLTVAPERGSAVFFSYQRPYPSSLSLHGGEPVTAGEKWIATKWLRQRQFY